MRDTVAELIAAAQAVVDAAGSMTIPDEYGECGSSFADEPEVKALADALLTHELLGGANAR